MYSPKSLRHMDGTERDLRKEHKELASSLRDSEGRATKLSRQLSDSEKEFMRMAERVPSSTLTPLCSTLVNLTFVQVGETVAQAAVVEAETRARSSSFDAKSPEVL